MEILDRALDAIADHHSPRLSADLTRGDDLLMEVVNHDLALQPDRMVVALHIPPQLLLGLLSIELRIAFDLGNQLVVAVHRRVGLEHIEDEPFIHRLLHRVAMEGPMLDFALTVWG